MPVCHGARIASAFTAPLLAVALPIGLCSPASAATVDRTAATAFVPGAASTAVATAAQAHRSVVAFRGQMRSTLQDYLARYRGRLTVDEYTRFAGLAAKVDRDLGALSATSATTARLARGPQRARAARSADAAYRAYQRSYAEALSTLAQVQPILQPKLGLLEAMDAKVQLDTRLAEFRAVGDRLLEASSALQKH